MIDTLIVALVVATAFFFFARSLYRTVAGKKSGCGSGCCECASKSACAPDDKRLL